MKLIEKIERVFAHRPIPDAVVDVKNCFQIDSDVEEALWFTGRDWHELTWQNWQEHSCAIYFFDREAFAYYLPSLLLLSSQHPSEELMAADSLISQLDCSPDPEGWPKGLARRFLGLNWAELAVLKEWLLQVCEYIPYKGVGIAASGSGDTFGRAFDTVDLLQKEVERRHHANR
jgi:hypothetical protein